MAPGECPDRLTRSPTTTTSTTLGPLRMRAVRLSHAMERVNPFLGAGIPWTNFPRVTQIVGVSDVVKIAGCEDQSRPRLRPGRTFWHVCQPGTVLVLPRSHVLLGFLGRDCGHSGIDHLELPPYRQAGLSRA